MELNKLIAKDLLKIKAVFFRPEEPFTWASGIKVGVPCTWASSNDRIAKISNGKVVGVSEGKTTITTTALGQKITVNVTVKGSAPAVKKGDINDDGKINSADALMVLQCSVGTISFTSDQKKKGDINGDGSINSSDALKILQYSVGLISTL